MVNEVKCMNRAHYGQEKLKGGLCFMYCGEWFGMTWRKYAKFVPAWALGNGQWAMGSGQWENAKSQQGVPTGSIHYKRYLYFYCLLTIAFCPTLSY
jgi:hypothetical protein